MRSEHRSEHNVTTPNFNRGGKRAEEEAKKRNTGFAKTPWLRLEDGDQVYLRLIDDSEDWIWVNQHEFISTKGAPPDFKAEGNKKWPTTMGAVCRRDEAFQGIYNDCYICDHVTKDGKKARPALRLYARAVEREQVLGTQEMLEAGKLDQYPDPSKMVDRRVGFKDAQVEEPILDKEGKPTGKTEMRRKIVVLRFGMKNFFGALQGLYDVYGKLTDKDLSVTRKGSDTDTVYSIVPLEPTPGHDLADPVLKARYEEAALAAGADLTKIISDQASDDYYARFFDKTKDFPSSGKGKDDTESEGAPVDQQAKPEARAADPEALRRMREKVLNANRPVQTEEPAAASSVNFE
jgi:hypothetical protein